MKHAIDTVEYIEEQVKRRLQRPGMYGDWSSVEMQVLTLLELRGYILGRPCTYEVWKELLHRYDCVAYLTQDSPHPDREARNKLRLLDLRARVLAAQGEPPDLDLIEHAVLAGGEQYDDE